MIKADSESSAEFTHLREKYKFIPDIDKLLLLNYEHLTTVIIRTKEDTEGNVIKEETIRTIGGSIDKINYDSAQKTAEVIVITPDYFIKAIYFWKHTEKGWQAYNIKDSGTGR